jgi:chorismate mutase/prephenate dehydratase
MIDQSAAEARLAAIRHEIDTIDNDLLGLIAARASLGLEAGEVKALLGRPIHDASREAAILDRIATRGAGAISAEDLRALWALLLAATRRAEERRAR